jgi:hypothetical protein
MKVCFYEMCLQYLVNEKIDLILISRKSGACRGRSAEHRVPDLIEIYKVVLEIKYWGGRKQTPDYAFILYFS